MPQLAALGASAHARIVRRAREAGSGQVQTRRRHELPPAARRKPPSDGRASQTDASGCWPSCSQPRSWRPCCRATWIQGVKAGPLNKMAASQQTDDRQDPRNARHDLRRERAGRSRSGSSARRSTPTRARSKSAARVAPAAATTSRSTPIAPAPWPSAQQLRLHRPPGRPRGGGEARQARAPRRLLLSRGNALLPAARDRRPGRRLRGRRQQGSRRARARLRQGAHRQARRADQS